MCPTQQSLYRAATLFIHHDLRRKRRGSAPTRAHHQHWNVYDLKKSPHTTEEGGNRSFQPWPTLIHKVVHALLLTILEQTKQRGTQSKRRNTLLAKKAQNVRPVQTTNYSSEKALHSKETKEARPDALPSDPFTTSGHFKVSHRISLTVTARPQ